MTKAATFATMRTISKPRCPNSQCLKSFRDRLRPVREWEPPRPKWFEDLVGEKSGGDAQLPHSVFECPYCHVVWTQPSNFDPGFRAVLRGCDRGNPARLEPVPPDAKAIDPPVKRVAEGRLDRRPNRRR